MIVQVTKAEEIPQILKLANEYRISIIPVSSKVNELSAAEAPHSENAVILDLSKMNQVLTVDRKNRMCMIEPGVTFEQLIPIAKEAGLRLLTPLLPTAGKSVLTSALERDPIIQPRFHWDASDPLLCTEVVFGTGDLFRTGSAAGPGTIEEQRASGQAQKNPLGPSQFDPFRLIQGAQGSIGIVSWITLKCELLQTTQKSLYVQSKSLNDLFNFTYTLLKRRYGDELFILNALNLAILLKDTPDKINKIRSGLLPWTLLVGIGGSGAYGADKLAFLEAEISDIAKEHGVQLLTEIKGVPNSEVMNIFNNCTKDPWRLRYMGDYQDIFFITTLDKTPKFMDIMKKNAEKVKIPFDNIGIYIQPLVQGCNCHCEFDIYYNPSNAQEKQNAKSLFETASIALMENGAFFSRPYGLWADEMYKRISPQVVDALQKVKSIFDPNNVLHRGALCFKEVRA
ncbi:MAG: FAD-binding oxidoreductase [Candidatus Helarchaeota archaeon]|nr:FAD-binding oxidoreductase [Candidatus Helarchaeota archaeon]